MSGPDREDRYEALVSQVEAALTGEADPVAAMKVLDLSAAHPEPGDLKPIPRRLMELVVDRHGAVIRQNETAFEFLGLRPGDTISVLFETPEAARSFLSQIIAHDTPIPAILHNASGERLCALAVKQADTGYVTLHEVRSGLSDQTQMLFSEAIGLTASERQVYLQLLEGKNAEAIAGGLGRTTGTVRQHVKAILSKAGVRSQVNLVCQAYAMSLVALREKHPPAPEALRIRGVAGGAGTMDMRLHRLGQPGGMPVLLFHGALFGLSGVPGMAAAAQSLGLDVIAPERPGYGKNPMTQAGQEAARMAAQAAAVLDALEIDRVVLVAHDVGTRFAVEFALTCPSRVAAVIAAPTTPPMQSWAQTSKMPLKHRVNAWAAQHFPSVMDKLVSLGLAQVARRGVQRIPRLVFGDCHFDQAIMADPANRYALDELFALVWQQDGAGFRADMFVTNEDWSDLLPRIGMPFIAMHGARSQTVSETAVRDMVATLPQGQFVLVEGAGHTMPLSHSALILRQAFIAGVRAGLVDHSPGTG